MRKPKYGIVTEADREAKLPPRTIFNEEIYDRCMAMAAANPGPGADQATQWIHLCDCVQRGTVSPMEAYDAFELGYVPETLRTRASSYIHLL